MFRSFAVVWSLAIVLAAPQLARAQDDQFQTLVDQALEEYRAREYDQAAATFESAYKIRQEPELLYNIARSHEKALHRDQAIDAYRRFLELKGTTAELRANARTALEALERERAAISTPARTVPAERPRIVEDEGAGRATQAATPREESSHTLEYVMMGSGGAIAAAGLIFTVLAFQANSDFDDATTRDDQLRLRDSTNRNAAIADVLVIGGVLLGGAGTLMLLLSDDGENKVAAGPSFDGDSFALSFSGTF